jgi:branched-chain amino acid transport system permease protein
LSARSSQFGTGKTGYYYIILALLAAAVLAAWLVQRSRIGFYLAAIREDPEGARSVGINLRSCKLIAIAVSALFTALGGSFYAQYVLFIDPGSVLSLNLSILISLVAILGGVGTLWGPLIGALVLLPLSEFTRVYLANLGGGGRAVNLVIYGFLIMLISAYQPNGLVGLFKRRRKRSGLDQGSLADQRPPEGALV